jgi:hypothetical protein
MFTWTQALDYVRDAHQTRYNLPNFLHHEKLQDTATVVVELVVRED